MKAVATVVMNRVNAAEGEYARISQGGNIRNIIYQTGQFDCATDNLFGRYNPQNIYNMNPTDIHYYIENITMHDAMILAIIWLVFYRNPNFKKTLKKSLLPPFQNQKNMVLYIVI